MPEDDNQEVRWFHQKRLFPSFVTATWASQLPSSMSQGSRARQVPTKSETMTDADCHALQPSVSEPSCPMEGRADSDKREHRADRNVVLRRRDEPRVDRDDSSARQSARQADFRVKDRQGIHLQW
jgi:hypothetical protein